MPLPEPINLPKWLEQNKDKLQPPIGNYCLHKSSEIGGQIVMLVGGPNNRTDYHINPTEEWFYQYRGQLNLHVVEIDASTGRQEFRVIQVNEGDSFLLPGNVPHNPVRGANTIGIVIESNRPPGKLDRMRWYCEKCKVLVFEEAFQCTNLGTQLKPVVEKYATHRELRTCQACKHVNKIP